MWWSICNQNNHFTRRRPPVHFQSLAQRSSDRFWPISSTGSVQGLEVFLHLFRIGREAEVTGYVGMILGWMISEGN